MTQRLTPVRRWARRLVLGVAILTAAFIAVSAVGVRFALAGSRAPLPVPAQQLDAHYQSVTFPSRVDHLTLSGWLLPAAHPNGRSFILVHGWRGNREDVDFVPLARALLARGYDVLLFDLRGSGASQGTSETFATTEPRDLLGAYDFMVARGYSPHLMTILGNSMGAATVIEAAPQLGQVAALVADSAFANLGSSLEGGLTHLAGLPGFLAWPAMFFSRAYGVLPDLSPVSVVSSLPHRAFLFIHARGDQLLPYSNALQLGAASADPATRTLIINGTKHVDTYTHDPAAYLRALLAFVNSQIGATPTVR